MDEWLTALASVQDELKVKALAIDQARARCRLSQSSMNRDCRKEGSIGRGLRQIPGGEEVWQRWRKSICGGRHLEPEYLTADDRKEPRHIRRDAATDAALPRGARFAGGKGLVGSSDCNLIYLPSRQWDRGTELCHSPNLTGKFTTTILWSR